MSPNVNPTEPGDLSCSGKQGDPDMTDTVTMPAAPPPEWINKAARALTGNPEQAHLYERSRKKREADAQCVLAAIWPDVLAAVAAHEQWLRQTIANEIDGDGRR